MERKRVGILLFEGVEPLDFCGPFEVFTVVRSDESRRRETESPFEVLLVSQTEEPVTTSGGMKVLPHITTARCPLLDILVVPGGWGTRKAMNDVALIDWLKEKEKEVSLLASVCAGALLLAKAGVMDGRSLTTHATAIELMRELFPSITVSDDKRWVQDGKIWSSAGISAGIDLSLVIVANMLGDEVARATARQMEYPYPIM